MRRNRSKNTVPLFIGALAVAAGGFFYVSRRKKKIAEIEACINQQTLIGTLAGQQQGLDASRARRLAAASAAVQSCGDPQHPKPFKWF
jgi:LPXTG-motif cell wall-anchored protein